MKFKILTFDGRPVKSVTYDQIVYNEPDDVTLWAPTITIQDVINKTAYKEPWKSKRAKLIRKCDLEEVELRFTKEV